MYSPLHAVTGFLIARAVPHPLLMVIAGIASHYALDAVPHGDMRMPPGWSTGKRFALIVGLDLSIAAIAITMLLSAATPAWRLQLVGGSVSGLLPDVLWGIRRLFNHLNWQIPIVSRLLDQHQRWHDFMHVKTPHDAPYRLGLVLQIALLTAILLLAYAGTALST